MLSARNLGLSLPDPTRRRSFGPPEMHRILNGVDLSLEPGDTLAIVGESGSGKTSLARTLLRLYEPTAGSLTFEGLDITHLPEA